MISSLAAGGSERKVAMLANAWAARGRLVTVVTLAHRDVDFFELDPRVDRIDLDLLTAPAFPGGSLVLNASRLRALRSAVRASQPDVLLTFVERMNILVLGATLGLDVPVVVSEVTVPWRYSIGPIRERLRRLLYPRAAAVVVPSPGLADWARGLVRADRVHVIPNPVEIDGARRRPEPIVVGLGRLSPEKGFDLLIEAFAMTRERHPEWRLVIAGEGAEREALLRRADELGVSASVELPGAVDARELFGRAGVFVLSSRFEGFGTALIEAMAGGVPSIAADCPVGPRHIITDGIDGLLVPPEDSAALALALGQLLAAETRREELGRAARSVGARFRLDVVVDAWESIFTSLWSERSI